MNSIDYAELHCISNFSFLRGASFPEELVEQSVVLGYKALAITDDCSLAGVVRAHMAAKSHQQAIKLIIGSEFVLDDGLKLVLLACNRRGYGELSHLITQARMQASKGEYRIDRNLLENNLPQHCLALWLPQLEGVLVQPAEELSWLLTLFPHRLWISVELLLTGYDRNKLTLLETISSQYQVPLCACGGVYMHIPQRRMMQDTLTAIRLGKPITELGYDMEANGQRHLRSREQLAKLYPQSLLQQSIQIAQRCNFSLDELRYEYPNELVPAGHTPHSWLRYLTEQGMAERWPKGISSRVRENIERELLLVRELKYEHFFLTVEDIVRFARQQGILCQGRGSAANSAICYCLGITEVNPDNMDLLFERFLSKERNEPPDIDVDFENARREEVIQYIYNKYGRHRAAIAATVITYQARSAIRDIGKALGLGNEIIDHLAKAIYWWSDDIKQQIRDSGTSITDPVIERLIYLVQSIIGFPRHLSQHVGGFIISQGPLSELVPVENAAMPNRSIIQWEKNDLESLGLLKVDVLALGMLTAISKALKMVGGYTGKELTMANIQQDDKAVYDMICKADTVGVFQIESRAQMSMLPRLKPRNYYDLVIQIAIVRPGPIQGDMVHPYLARRSGKEKVSYPSKEIEAVLERTLGIPIFQEQVMQIAMVAAGFTPGEADQLRRAMAAWKKKGGLEPFEGKLISGMKQRGYEEDFAMRLFNQIKGFGDYGFPESHSASFALIAYVSCWLKYHHPTAFTCALLNSQPMGFYAPAQLIQDVKRHGVTVLPVDVNYSDKDSSLVFFDKKEVDKKEIYNKEGDKKKLGKKDDNRKTVKALRLGLGLTKGLSDSGARFIEEQRKEHVFISVQDLVDRAHLNKKDIESLAAADALKSISGNRHKAFWQASGIEKTMPLFSSKQVSSKPVSSKSVSSKPISSGLVKVDTDADVLLPVPAEAQNIFADYSSTGLSLRRHPVALFRNHLNKYNVSTASSLGQLQNNSFARVTGIVTCRQRPQTAAGVTFLTLEDESGFINVVVWPNLVERQRHIVRRANLLAVEGTVQHSEGVIHLIAKQLTDLSGWLQKMELQSRDFC